MNGACAAALPEFGKLMLPSPSTCVSGAAGLPDWPARGDAIARTSAAVVSVKMG